MRKTNLKGLGLSRKGKKAINTNPRLLTISDNERHLLLGERVASILEKASNVDDFNIPLANEKTDFPEIPKRLNQYRNQDCSLWTKSSLFCEPHEEESYQQKLEESNRVKQLNTTNSFAKSNACSIETPDRIYIKEESILQSAEVNETASCSSASYCERELKLIKSCNKSSLEDRDGNESDVSRDLFESDASEPEDETPTSQNPVKKFFPIFQSSQASQVVQKKETKEDSLPKKSIMSNRSIDSDFETPKRMKENLFPRMSLLETNGKPKANQNQSQSQTQSSSKIKDWRPPSLSRSDHTDLGQDLLSLFLEKIDSDLTVYGREEKPIRVHKLILKARCPKLLKEIVTEKTSKLGRKKEVIPLTCFSHTAVKSLLCYIYCGRILPPAFDVKDLCQKDLDEIVELGVRYGLDLSLKPEYPPHPQSISATPLVKTTEISIQTDDVKLVIVKDLEEKATQTENLDKSIDSYCHPRLDERAHEYREMSESPYDNLNEAFGMSGNVFEESFNDKVFANKLVDDSHSHSSIRKSRKTWSEKSYKFSSNSNESDNDSIIILEDEGEGQDSEMEKKDWNVDDDVDIDANVNVEDVEDSFRKHSPLGRPASQPMMHSTWNKSLDDFFANLPSDEQLLNLPPTSPTGSNTYTGGSPIRPPRSPARNIITGSSSDTPTTIGAGKKVGAGRKRKAKKISDEQLEHEPQTKKPAKRMSRPRGKEPRYDDGYCQFESDDERDDERRLCSGRGKTKNQSQNQATKRQTPLSSSQGSRRSTSGSQNRNQTPMLNYSLIDTPILKKELKRYGLKPLPRSKAKIMLRHIYKETHK